MMPIVVERKLFATGDSLAITLPKDWIRSFKLKAGNSLEVVLGEDLIVRAKKEEENIDSHTDLTDLD